MFRKNKTLVSFCLIMAFVISCESEKKYPTLAIVNGKEITSFDTSAGAPLEQIIENTVLQTESKRIGVPQTEMLSFFDSLKTRKIPKDQVADFMKNEFKDKEIKEASREEILNLIREKQFEQAKKKYIAELKNRSTIWIIKDGQKVKYETSQK